MWGRTGVAKKGGIHAYVLATAKNTIPTLVKSRRHYYLHAAIEFGAENTAKERSFELDESAETVGGADTERPYWRTKSACWC